MYWPIGAPRVYAADVERHFDPRSSLSEDGIEDGDVQSTKQGNEGHPAPVDHGSEDEKRIERSRTISEGSITTNGYSTSEGKKKTSSDSSPQEPLIGLRVSRNGQMFATITASTLTLWQTRPSVVLTAVVRSSHSLTTYGQNVSLLLRPDSAIFVVQTSLGYLITYALTTDPESRVYKPRFTSANGGHSRRQSVGHMRGLSTRDQSAWSVREGNGVREVNIRFRMVIKVDAGIARALALDDELVVATEKPAAVQCIRWAPDSTGNQTSTELLSKMSWMSKKASILDMVHDRPMNLSTWCTSDGKAFAVQRITNLTKESDSSKKLFQGYCFHTPKNEDSNALKAAINARFSLIALACADGSISVYTVKDYVGSIPISHKLRLSVSTETSGRVTFLSYAVDGYCLFVGYEKGWATWSIYGKPGGNSFIADRTISSNHGEIWLNGITTGSWLGGGGEILLIGPNDDRLWVLEMARSAVAGCYTSSNISRSLMQTRSGLMIYRGYDLPDLTTISADSSLWHQVPIPPAYLTEQWPMRLSVISPDGRYVAIAGRRGLAHYSVTSGRWKTFVSEAMENDFAVRGGMCWYQHILIAAVEAGEYHELRLYSRELALDNSLILHIENLPAPVVLADTAGNDSLLVYTYDNILYHYIVSTTTDIVQLVLVGQIAFHGIVRAPARVRALSWILPDDQIRDGDPAQDVVLAAVIFLVDGKLVLLQPCPTEDGAPRYDMRVLASQVEFFALMRDQLLLGQPDIHRNTLSSPADEPIDGTVGGHGLRDSLWLFDGIEMRVWTDVQEVIRYAQSDLGQDLPSTAHVPLDFYPLSVLLSKGILLGVEAELVQRRDVGFAFFRFALRTHLFLPQVLRHHLSHFDSPAALHLSHHYQSLLYFPHALEILLHDVLDEEVDRTSSSTPNTPSNQPPSELLPTVLSFLSSFPQYLDILVQCTRKTELRSWRTLFAYLPPPQALFEESLQKGSLKTAGGYLLVLHTFEDLGSSSQQLLRLLKRAKDEADWELCKELARFLMALDESGRTLREALSGVVELNNPREPGPNDQGYFSLPLPPRMEAEAGAAGADAVASASATIPVVVHKENAVNGLGLSLGNDNENSGGGGSGRRASSVRP